MSINSLVLRGRLGSDPEARFTPNGVQVTQFNIAVDRGWGDKKRTMWVKVQLWRKQAENAMEWLKKGDDVIIKGELDFNEWTDDKGQKRSMMFMVGDHFERCNRRDNGNREPGSGWPDGASKDAPSGDPDEVPAFADTDEIPF